MVKVLRLSRADITYKLALEDANYQLDNIDLDSFYNGLLSVKKPRDRYFIYYMISVIFLLFVHLGGIKEAELLGVRPTQDIMQLSALLFMASISLFYTYYQGKLVRFDHLFTSVLQRSSQARGQTLILKYPEAYSVLQFSYYIVGRPKYLFPTRAIPIRLTALGVLLVPTLIGIFALWAWLIGSVSLQLWYTTNEIGTFWIRAIVVTSWLIILASMTFPTADLGKRKHHHYGLTQLLGEFQIKHPNRYKKFIAIIGTLQEKMRNNK